MVKDFSVGKAIKKAKTEGFVLNCKMPLGYGSGIPLLSVRNGSLCMTVPYLRYQITGKVDETLVFPIRYTVTFELPEMNVVGFEDLSYNDVFSDLDFNKAIGKFRHEALKQYDQKQYFELKNELYSLYDKLIASLLEGAEFPPEEEARMKELLCLIVEPSLMPMYKYIDSDFYNKFMVQR